MNKYYRLDREKKKAYPCMLEEINYDSDRRIARTQVGDFDISTVFLCINHASSNDDLPLIYETLVFSGKNNGDEIDGDRYSTWEEAEKGHWDLVEKYIGHPISEAFKENACKLLS